MADTVKASCGFYDPKQLLYAFLGKRRLGTPSYEMREEIRRRRSHFQCNVHVPNIPYVGLGRSTTKKDAMAFAAKDFMLYLVRQGTAAVHDFYGVLTENDVESGPPNANSTPVGEATTAATSSATQVSAAANSEDFSGDILTGFEDKLNEWQKFVAPKAELTTHEKYVNQKQAELSTTSGNNVLSSLHGNWNSDNCKKGLNEFCQKMKISMPRYRVSNDARGGFVAECGLYVPQLMKRIESRGEGNSKKHAETHCALSIVKQLYHLQVIPPAGEKVQHTGVRERLPIYDVSVNPRIVEELEDYLLAVNVPYVQNLGDDSKEEWPRILTVSERLVFFETTANYAMAPIIWSPPAVNWDPWRQQNVTDDALSKKSLDILSLEILVNERAKVINPRIKHIREHLPIHRVKQEVLKMVAENSVVLIRGSTGCGKSTQVCQYILEDYIASHKAAEFNAYVTQPRRISAISLAERVAKERSEDLGKSVGYNVRFDSVLPRPHGAILFVTLGVLIRRLEGGLRGISHVIIDEIHERDINTDIFLIIIRDIIRTNPQLRVILMSATVDTTIFSDYFETKAIVDIPERTHHVESFFIEDVIEMTGYRPPGTEELDYGYFQLPHTMEDRYADGFIDPLAIQLDETTFGLPLPEVYSERTKMALKNMDESRIQMDLIECLLTYIHNTGIPGAVLVFLPGWNEIFNLINRLRVHSIFGKAENARLLPLHSQLTLHEQQKVFEAVPGNVRKIVVATNIAETSITIDDVVFVIDSCRLRDKITTSHNNMVQFATLWAAKSNLKQRRGRAGRVQRGFCYRLCTKKRYDKLPDHPVPEILKTPLAEIVLLIKYLRLGKAYDFLEKAVKPPPIDAVTEAEILLKDILALDDHFELTELGRILTLLACPPVFGKVIVMATIFGIGDLMTTLGVLSSFNTIFAVTSQDKSANRMLPMHRKFAGTHLSDHIAVLSAFQRFCARYSRNEFDALEFCRQYFLNRTTMTTAIDAREQMRNVLRRTGFPEGTLSDLEIDVGSHDPQLGLFKSMLVSAFYPNVAVHKRKRWVYVLGQHTAVFSPASMFTPYNNTEDIRLPSPFIVFTEKMRSREVTCIQNTLVTAVQLLLFGSRKVEALSPELVVLDDMIQLRMPASLAAKIVALRPCMEARIVTVCQYPQALGNPTARDCQLVDLLLALSSHEPDRVTFPEVIYSNPMASGGEFRRRQRDEDSAPAAKRRCTTYISSYSSQQQRLQNRFDYQVPIRRASPPPILDLATMNQRQQAEEQAQQSVILLPPPMPPPTYMMPQEAVDFTVDDF